MTPASAGRRGEVLAALRGSRIPLSINDIAEQLGVHTNTVRFHLEALVSTGQAERVDLPSTGPGRPPQAFRAHRGMDPAGPRNYRLLAEILVAQLADDPNPADRAREAGRAWGRHLSAPEVSSREEAVDGLIRLLDDLGFAPEPASEDRIHLRHCPFLDLIDNRTAIVCPIHLGLMQGALERRSAPITVDHLAPFAEPDLCLAHLAPAPTGPAT
ncbi:helix-turn-helix transcriptional regulator [Nocardia terpenica]|uniref:Transcriptional regulator n=1 Tax=Nocardia terpenica TaxID=455432 RepID=A0A164L9H3_9NOCA|nr:helix-turn-helix domain-containing protein [Nocardia terpenica]KZM72157.1 transcriptional regulator [Nocardia terpenica]NQE86704.1 helix-turn-helix domain-containing protein [Nocardia terpenica]